MSEKYISASKLKAHYSWLGKDATLSPKDVDDIIDAQPAADVEPVVRSKWELNGGDDSLDCFWFCNNCGWNIEEESDANKWDRCPHCGAHMMGRSGSGE